MRQALAPCNYLAGQLASLMVSMKLPKAEAC